MILLAIQTFSGLLVLAEALNKLERTDPLEPGLLHLVDRAVVCLKAVGWSMLAIGACGVMVAPLLGHPEPTIKELLLLVGFALLVLRSRLRELSPQELSGQS